MLRNTECSVTSQKTAAKETTGLTPKVIHTTRSRPCMRDSLFFSDRPLLDKWKRQPMSRKLIRCLVSVFCLSTKMFVELYHQVYPMYWATEGSATFGEFTVETSSHEIFQDFSQREFSVAKKEVGLVVCRNSF